jgi:hypothetical protein
MTHEYGHFTMCSIMADRDPQAIAWTVQRLGEGAADSRSDKVALFFESFADLFASQVAGGTNYLTPPVDPMNPTLIPGFTAANNNAASYCMGTPCVEHNFRGVGDSSASVFNDELGRIVTTYVDAFDAAGRTRTGNAPGNGDIWAFTVPPPAPLLVLAPTKYLPVNNTDDEKLSMPGAGWKTWMDRWMQRSALFNIGGFMPALTDAMSIHNPTATSCDICDLYARHSPDPRAATAISQSVGDRVIRQDICRQDEIRGWMDTRALPPLPFDAVNCVSCGLGQVSVNGACVSCAASQIVQANACVSCPSGSVPNAQRTACISCGNKAIAVGGVCVPCALDQGADLASNTCVTCPADLVIDWQTETGLCRELTFTTAPVPVPGDACPSEFWVEFQHYQSLLNVNLYGTRPPVRIDVSAVAFPLPTTQATCVSKLAQIDSFIPATTPGRFVFEGSRHESAGAWTTSPTPLCSFPLAVRNWPLTEIRSTGFDTVRYMLLRNAFTIGALSSTVPQQLRVTQVCPAI